MVSGLNGQSGHNVPSLAVKVLAHRYDIVLSPLPKMEEMIVLGRIFTIQHAGESHTVKTPAIFGHVTHIFSALIECPDCNRVCEMGTLNKECTKCTCEDHIITGTVYDEQSNPIVGASLYKFGHYDKLGVTDRVGKYR